LPVVLDPPPPSPDDVTTWPEFTGRLRALYEWCGRPKYRALCARCPGLSPAAVSNLIGRNPLTRPPETATVRFVEACLRYGGVEEPEEDVALWASRWTRIAGAPSGDLESPDGMRGPWRRWWVLGGAVVVAAAGLVGGVFFQRSGGDEGCRHLRGSIEDARMKRTWADMFQCPNRPRVGVYEKAGFGTEVAVLETDPSWFICWTRGQSHEGGNDVWYYTQGDRVTAMPRLNGWGYVPASDLRVGAAPDPGVTRRC
jgi:hypothetical protein